MNSRPPTASIDEPPAVDQGSRQGSGVAGLVPTLLRAAVPVALITLLAYTLAYQYSEREPTVYEATSRIVLSSSTNFSPIDANFSNSSPDRYVQNQADIITTLEVMNRAALLLADGTQATDLIWAVSAAPAGSSDGILVEGRADDPAVAARRADAVANAYAQFTAEQVNALADQAVATSGNDPDRIQSIRARAATFGDGVAVIQPATAPSAPTSPTPGRNGYLAAAAAFLLSTGLALSLRGRWRPTEPEVLAAEAGGPFLGEVPVRWLGSLPMPKQPRPAAHALALQGLRYRMRGSEPASVLLSSVGRDTSATSALLGLAAADAAQGRSVVIVDATPAGHLLRRAGTPDVDVSLTAAWAAGHDLDGALRSVPALAGTHGGRVRIGRISRDGRASADVLRGVLTTLSGSADLVLVDAGPVVSDAAAFTLLGEVSGAVAVVRGQRGSRELREFRRRLALAGSQCAGVLVSRRTWLPSLGRANGPSATDVPVLPGQGRDRDRAALDPSAPKADPDDVDAASLPAGRVS